MSFRFRASAGYCFSPLSGLLSTSRDFAALRACYIKVRGTKGDGGNFPCKKRFSERLGFKSPPLRQSTKFPISLRNLYLSATWGILFVWLMSLCSLHFPPFDATRSGARAPGVERQRLLERRCSSAQRPPAQNGDQTREAGSTKDNGQPSAARRRRTGRPCLIHRP
jgi:hypothetical protein